MIKHWSLVLHWDFRSILGGCNTIYEFTVLCSVKPLPIVRDQMLCRYWIRSISKLKLIAFAFYLVFDVPQQNCGMVKENEGGWRKDEFSVICLNLHSLWISVWIKRQTFKMSFSEIGQGRRRYLMRRAPGTGAWGTEKVGCGIQKTFLKIPTHKSWQIWFIQQMSTCCLPKLNKKI